MENVIIILDNETYFSQDFEYRILSYFLSLNIEIVQLMLPHSIVISYDECKRKNY